MPIIKCKECGKDVSTEAAACPNCGAAPTKKMSATMKYGGGFLALMFGLAALGSIFGSPRQQSAAVTENQQVQQSTAKAVPVTPPIEITAGKLFAAYQANEVAADLAYKGKRLAVTGTVKSIDKDFKNDPVVVLAVPNQFAGVSANFNKEAISQLAKLQKGASVTLTCIGAGKVITYAVLDCKS